MPKLTVDGKEIEFEQGASVLQVCESADIEIPRFCYHKRLKVAGNCRMCLVEIEGGPPKPTASCAFPAGDGMVVHTNSPMVKRAREGVLEFQLLNHPLDCPVCDQGGECDLQDLSYAYGKGESRYKEVKHVVSAKNYGPLIKTNMTRCIHCTRCVRFIEDIAGTGEIGGIGRGEDMEIGTFVEKSINSELSGNIIDICPVGALNSKPYNFRARSWELTKTNSIDVMDAVGSNIRIDTRRNEVMRIMPSLHEDINEEWISDKTRFSYDGLKNQRLDSPMVKNGGKLVRTSWDEAFSAVVEKIESITSGKKFAAIAGATADAESMLMLKELMKNLGSGNIDCREDGANISTKTRASYLFNTTIAGIENADACLLIGTNPRHEAAIINARLRKRFLKGGFPVASIGEDVDLTYEVDNLGNNPDILTKILTGKHDFSEVLKSAKNPMIIVGQSVFVRDDSDGIMNIIQSICEKFNVINDKWNGFNVLHTVASRVAGLDLGFVPDKDSKNVNEILEGAKSGDIELVYLLNSDEIDMSALEKAFVIYQGHHGDAGAHHADVIFPGAAYTEKSATYVNTEGRVQHTTQAVSPPGEAREDWTIIKELAWHLDFDSKDQSILQLRDDMVQTAPHFARIGEIVPAKWKAFGEKSKIMKEPFAKTIKNFYMTDPISRASRIMSECTVEFVENKKDKKAA